MRNELMRNLLMHRGVSPAIASVGHKIDGLLLAARRHGTLDGTWRGQQQYRGVLLLTVDVAFHPQARTKSRGIRISILGLVTLRAPLPLNIDEPVSAQG